MGRKASAMQTTESSEKQLRGAALTILEQDGPMKVRQLFWRLVSAGEIHNDVGSYLRLGQIMARVREKGLCRYELIIDQPPAPSTIDATKQNT
jgi:hypothetical protein